MITIEDIAKRMEKSKGSIIDVFYKDIKTIIEKEGIQKMVSLDNFTITSNTGLFDELMKHITKETLKTIQGCFIYFEIATNNTIGLIAENMEYLQNNFSEDTDIVFSVGTNFDVSNDAMNLMIVLTGLSEDMIA